MTDSVERDREDVSELADKIALNLIAKEGSSLTVDQLTWHLVNVGFGQGLADKIARDWLRH
ncbi:MAG: hypothetical protein KBC81_00155 [Candidatus Pacebacteria bacterium]|nr:hypothetical protein [Candidatus Paceibacterota bacterium]